MKETWIHHETSAAPSGKSLPATRSPIRKTPSGRDLQFEAEREPRSDIKTALRRHTRHARAGKRACANSANAPAHVFMVSQGPCPAVNGEGPETRRNVMNPSPQPPENVMPALSRHTNAFAHVPYSSGQSGRNRKLCLCRCL